MRTRRSHFRRQAGGMLTLATAALALAALWGAGAGASSTSGSAAAPPSNGVFKGSTAQGRSVSLTVSGGAIRNLKYAFKVGGCSQTVNTSGRIRVSGGKFRSSSSTYDPISFRNYTTTITGTFNTSTSARGAINASTACGSKRVTYRATRR